MEKIKEMLVIAVVDNRYNIELFETNKSVKVVYKYPVNARIHVYKNPKEACEDLTKRAKILAERHKFHLTERGLNYVMKQMYE